MKAIIITAFGAPEVLKIQERSVPQPASDEVLIKVKAAGINRPDTFQRKGNYPAPEGAPQDIPGLEVAGVIEKCGEDIKAYKPGDKVCALVAGGGYAEYVTIHAGQCLPIPSNLSFVEAASLPETIFTVWTNVFQRGVLQPGENFLVHGGTSGIGVTAIQIAKAWGAQVFATAGTDEKCDKCVQLGANKAFNYKTRDFESELKDMGVDVILDMIGGNYFDKNLNILNPDGRLVYINAMKGPKVELNIIKMMRKRLTITGSTLRAREASFKASLAKEIHTHVWPMIESGKFKPVIYHTFPLEKAAEAHTLMETSEHVGKIVLEVG